MITLTRSKLLQLHRVAESHGITLWLHYSESLFFSSRNVVLNETLPGLESNDTMYSLEFIQIEYWSPYSHREHFVNFCNHPPTPDDILSFALLHNTFGFF